jgi:hypothetical protein
LQPEAGGITRFLSQINYRVSAKAVALAAIGLSLRHCAAKASGAKGSSIRRYAVAKLTTTMAAAPAFKVSRDVDHVRNSGFDVDRYSAAILRRQELKCALPNIYIAGAY